VSGERGSVSVVLAATLVVVFALAMGVADLGRVLSARARARTGADAAALAVAQELAFPTGLDVFRLADDYAAANGGVLTACACERGTFEAQVEVRVLVTDLLLLPGARWAVARARAVVDLPA
jgi:secretion/DNA translocation related TadE-like protein